MKGFISSCPYCGDKHGVRKHGRGRTGCQRYYCRACQKTFQAKYIYNVKLNMVPITG